MEWSERLQTIIDYVEDHLQRKQEPLNQQEVSELAGCSFDFFQKVFSYMNGISFSFSWKEYSVRQWRTVFKNTRILE